MAVLAPVDDRSRSGAVVTLREAREHCVHSPTRPFGLPHSTPTVGPGRLDLTLGDPMDATATVGRQTARDQVPALRAALVVLVLTVAGAGLAVAQLITPAGGTPPAGSHAVTLTTSYGSVLVGEATLSRPAPRAAATATAVPATAGEPAGDLPAARLVHVPVTLRNDSDATVSYRPEQFLLRAEGGQPAVPEDGPLLTGQLRPGAAVVLRLTFAVPPGAATAHLSVPGAHPAEGVPLPLRPAPITTGDGAEPAPRPHH